MKRPLTIAATAVLATLILYACASTIRTANTSFVTLTIGDTPNTALLKAEAATPWARFRYFVADAKWMPEAYAYIPSVVQVIVVTVTAADITTPIVGVASIKPDQTAASIKIEVQNGTKRLFTVEGIRGVDSQTYYRGTATTNLDGTDVNLPVSTAFVGTGIYVDPTLTPAVADQPSCGTQASPCATITYVLNTRPSTTNNDVILALPGTYKVGSVAAQETFPLQLKPGMALLCMGTGFSSVIDASTFLTTALRGNDNAAVDNCKFKVGQNGTGVTDFVGALPTATRINGSLFEVPTGATGPSVGIVLANDKSMLIDSAVTGTNASSQAIGVQVTGGKPSIISSTISKLPIGIDLAAAAGNALITGSTISGNNTGITMATPNKPTVTLSQITNNGTGIQMTNGIPSISSNIIKNNTSNGLSITGSASAQVTGNSIDHNNTGILISVLTGGDPIVNGNSIFCNTFTGADVSALTAIRLENNAWNRDANTSPPGPRVDIGNCLAGADICPRSVPDPIYVPFSTAVSNGCATP